MEKEFNKWKPGPAAEKIKIMNERNKLHQLTIERLSGNFVRRGILSINNEGHRKLIIDTGQAMILDNINIEYNDSNPLSALAQILSERKLTLLDWQMLSRNVWLSTGEALNFIKESGLQIADKDGTVYRYQDNKIMRGKDIVENLQVCEYLPETSLLLFSSLETQQITPEDELGRAMRETKGALPD